MGTSWREVLGLLIGLALCYGVISYALANAPDSRDTASEQTQKSAQQNTTRSQTTPTTSDGDTKTVTIRLAGSSGEPFGANFGNLDSSRSVEGVAPADYQVQVHTDPRSGDYVSATVWKTSGSSKELKVQIIDNGGVVNENSTTEDYGATGVRWRPGERPLVGGTTTPKTEKTKEDSVPRP